MNNQVVIQMAKQLKSASKKNEAPIWAKLAELALKPSSARRIVNLNTINNNTKEDDVVVVPGKILAIGNLDHKVSVCSFSISIPAAKKITSSGGILLNFKEMIEKFPKGKGVKIIG